MGRKKGNRIAISCRIDDNIYMSISKFSTNSGISKSELIELGMLYIIEQSNCNYFFNIDIKKFAEVRKFEILRNTEKKIRNDIMSKALFENRLKRDIYKLITLRAEKEDILDLIDSQYKEAKLYSNNSRLLLKMEKYRTLTISDLEKLIKLITQRSEEPKIDEDVRHRQEKYLDTMIEDSRNNDKINK